MPTGLHRDETQVIPGDLRSATPPIDAPTIERALIVILDTVLAERSATPSPA